MRWIIGLMFVAAFGWGAYWFVGSGQKEKAVETWLETRHASGWFAEYGDVDVKGFPNRFDTVVQDLALADPRSGWAWNAPRVELLTLSYKPNHIIALFPSEQIVSTPLQNISINSEQIKTSLVFGDLTLLPLERFTTTLAKTRFASNAGWNATLDSGLLASRQSAKAEFAHDIAFDAAGFRPSTELRRSVDASGILPDTFEKLHLSGTAYFDAPWDKAAIEGEKPFLSRIDLDDGNAIWGGLEVQAKGSVNLDMLGYPTGSLRIRAKNWKDMIALAENSGALEPTIAKTMRSGLGIVAALSGNKSTLDVPLTFKGRKMKIGPVTIGDAPKLNNR